MEDIVYPKYILDCRPVGRQRPGRPLKRLLDGYNREAETGHLSDLLRKEEEEEEVCLEGRQSFNIAFAIKETKLVCVCVCVCVGTKL
jgi:hypothetical protein